MSLAVDGTALIVIDVQNDFCPGGALGKNRRGNEDMSGIPMSRWETLARLPVVGEP
jgi:nicotinamidase-related amidase